MDTIRTISGNQKCVTKEDILIKDLLLEEIAKELLEQREFFKKRCKKNIETCSLKIERRITEEEESFVIYKEGDLVAIKRTQFGAGLKLRPKFLDPYKVTRK
ncbi:uncharacterized protein TNCV_4506401 [Trichonephila clavipes]|nr:uncharacterized protein TNCV_4506401 [Trichonephila clavipes]